MFVTKLRMLYEPVTYLVIRIKLELDKAGDDAVNTIQVISETALIVVKVS